LGRPNVLGGFRIETLETGSASGIGIFHQLTDFCADQNRGFAGSNALIALQWQQRHWKTLFSGKATCPHFIHTKRPSPVGLSSMKWSIKTQYGQRGSSTMAGSFGEVGLKSSLILRPNY